MNETDVIIIGAGACGLVAATELLSAGKTVRILEANTRPGGRILTFENGMEGGAEFVHGDLPVTKRLITESGLSLVPVEGEIFENKNGKWKPQENFIEDWDEVMKPLSELKHDLSLKDFLQQYFSEEKYAELRSSICRFAEGYDLVDINDASMFALKEEWKEEADEQYRVKNGYGAIIQYMERKIVEQKGIIEYGKPVIKINRAQNEVTVITENGETFHSKKIMVTVPQGVWHRGETAKGFIHFEPALPGYLKAMQHIGFGCIIKFVFDFSECFWNEKIPGAGFIFSDEKIPTWWTYLPSNNNRLAGWFGGPSTLAYQNADQETLFDLGTSTLSAIFNLPVSYIKQLITAHQIINWNEVNYTYGGYSYSTLATSEARTFLKQPVEDCIFFSGEGLYEGPYAGMVEAALQNGIDVAQRMLSE